MRRGLGAGALQDSLRSVSRGGVSHLLRGKSPGLAGWYSTFAAEHAARVTTIGIDALLIEVGS